MKRSCFLAVAATVGVAASVHASPVINGAKINARVFNDFPTSTFSSTNNYAAHINLTDGHTDGHPAFANRHNWRLSSDGGASSAQFANGDSFSVFADVRISVTGTGAGEGGLQVSPWWSQDVDGQFNMRTTDGEVAIFGGRLPFYSFTGSQGVHYVPGTTVRVGIEYEPQGLSMASPGLIRYSYGALNSGWLAFDEGNPFEDPPHGLWGTLNYAAVGGMLQIFGQQTFMGSVSADFDNITYLPTPGSVMALAFGGVFAARRRR